MSSDHLVWTKAARIASQAYTMHVRKPSCAWLPPGGPWLRKCGSVLYCCLAHSTVQLRHATSRDIIIYDSKMLGAVNTENITRG